MLVLWTTIKQATCFKNRQLRNSESGSNIFNISKNKFFICHGNITWAAFSVDGSNEIYNVNYFLRLSEAILFQCYRLHVKFQVFNQFVSMTLYSKINIDIWVFVGQMSIYCVLRTVTQLTIFAQAFYLHQYRKHSAASAVFGAEICTCYRRVSSFAADICTNVSAENSELIRAIPEQTVWDEVVWELLFGFRQGELLLVTAIILWKKHFIKNYLLSKSVEITVSFINEQVCT